MTSILHIKSSSNPKGVTRQVGPVVIERLKQNANAKVIERDLVTNPVPHVTPQFITAMYAGNDKAPELTLSNQLIDELFASDIIVIEVPMYNFAIPSVLKAWIDHVIRKGKTFNYGAAGPEGLLKGKQVILVLGRGGVYSEGPMKAMDYQETYLRAVLGFAGLTNIETIYIEGVGLGPEKAAAAVEQAKQKAGALTQRAA